MKSCRSAVAATFVVIAVPETGDLPASTFLVACSSASFPAQRCFSIRPPTAVCEYFASSGSARPCPTRAIRLLPALFPSPIAFCQH